MLTVCRTRNNAERERVVTDKKVMQSPVEYVVHQIMTSNGGTPGKTSRGPSDGWLNGEPHFQSK
jgi:hypothetical protein